jgi:hypothetical protein
MPFASRLNSWILERVPATRNHLLGPAVELLASVFLSQPQECSYVQVKRLVKAIIMKVSG